MDPRTSRGAMRCALEVGDVSVRDSAAQLIFIDDDLLPLHAALALFDVIRDPRALSDLREIEPIVRRFLQHPREDLEDVVIACVRAAPLSWVSHGCDKLFWA